MNIVNSNPGDYSRGAHQLRVAQKGAIMVTCKGVKKDGTPCRSGIVLKNGYCRAHQDQAEGKKDSK